MEDYKKTLLRQFGINLPLLFSDLWRYSRDSNDDIGHNCLVACSKELRILLKELMKLNPPTHKQDHQLKDKEEDATAVGDEAAGDDMYLGDIPDLLQEIARAGERFHTLSQSASEDVCDPSTNESDFRLSGGTGEGRAAVTNKKPPKCEFPGRIWMSSVTSLQTRLTEDEKRAHSSTETHGTIKLILASLRNQGKMT